MAIYILADRIQISRDNVVYRIRFGDPNSTTPAQDVVIPLGPDGHCTSEADITTATGEELSWMSHSMLGKLLREQQKREDWPERTGKQS